MSKTKLKVPHINLVREAHLAELRKQYPMFEIGLSEESISVEGIGTEQDFLNIQSDLNFLALNPHIPIENLCNRLDNYKPLNSSQEKLIKAAKYLLGSGPGSQAGLFVVGTAGVGKTHIAVSVAKELLQLGQRPLYINPELYPRAERTYKSHDCFVLDDLNSPYGFYFHLFKDIIVRTHDFRGRVLATSNTSLDVLLNHGLDRDSERERLLDRFKGLFYVVEVEGKSQRLRKPWYEGLDEGEGVPEDSQRK